MSGIDKEGQGRAAVSIAVRKDVLIDAFFVSPKLPIDNLTLCRPSPGVFSSHKKILLVFLFR